MTSRGWYSDNRRLTAEEIEALRNDAQSFKDSVLYNYIRNELRYLANLKMFEHGIKEENTVFGRAMLYNLEVIEKFIKGISKI